MKNLSFTPVLLPHISCINLVQSSLSWVEKTNLPNVASAQLQTQAQQRHTETPRTRPSTAYVHWERLKKGRRGGRAPEEKDGGLWSEQSHLEGRKLSKFASCLCLGHPCSENNVCVGWKGDTGSFSGTQTRLWDSRPKPKAVLMYTPCSFPQCPAKQLIHWSDVVFGHPLKNLETPSPCPAALCAYWRGKGVIITAAADLSEEGGRRRREKSTDIRASLKCPLPAIRSWGP